MSENEHIITTQWGTKATSFAALSDEQRRVRMQNCADLMADIKANTGIDVYLSYGCLLGAVRGGKMISHDFDIDLGFHVEGKTKEDIVRECRKLIRYLSETCHRMVVESNGQFKAAKMFADNVYMSIEFFVSWAEKDDFFLYFGIPSAKIAKEMLPFGEVLIEGVAVPAPKNPEVMVEAIYGSDWRIPNPNFRHDNIDWEPFQGFSVNKNKPYWDSYYSNKADNDVWAEFPSQFGAFCASEIKAGSRILDFGCGNGRDSTFFSQIGHDVLACDYSKVAIDLVKAKGETKGLTLDAEILNIYETSSVHRMIMNHSGEFDVIYSRFAMHAITAEGQDWFLRMAEKLLKEDGQILLEFRNSADEHKNDGTVLSDNERLDGHYRRFINKNAFLENVVQILLKFRNSVDEHKNDGTVLSDNERLDGHYRRFINKNAFLENVVQVGLSVKYVAEGQGFAKFKDEDPNVTRIILTR